MNKYRDKVAIVTGGASGIGKALVHELLKNGANVVIADIDHEGGKLAEEWESAGLKAAYCHLDVADKKLVEELIQRTFNQYGRLDFMFNNAGIAMYGELHNMTDEHWKRIMDINAWGVIHGTMAAYKIMKEQGFGHIINTASAAGLGPGPTSAAYAASKHAVVGLTTSLHYEAETFGVKVSAVCPAVVDTPIFRKAEALKINSEKVLDQINSQKQMTPEQCAKIILKGAEANLPVITTAKFHRTTKVLFILFPALERSLMRLVVKFARKASLE